MKKKNLVKMATITLAMTMALAGCTGGSSETPSTEGTSIVDTTEDITTMEDSTEDKTTEGNTTEEATSEDESTTVEDTTEEDTTEEENTSGEGTSTEEPTSEDESTTIETTTEKETETEPKAPETTVEPTTKEPETTKVPETKPTETEPTKPVATEPTTKPTEPQTSAPELKAMSISATVNGTHYVGDSLGATDFTVKVSMSDGTTLTNPAGWQANKLKLDAATTSITVSYGGVSTTISVNASERPAETQPQPTQPPQPVNATYNGIDLVKNACNYVGKLPYVLGGHSLSSGADCSNFTSLIYEQYGISLSCGAIYQFNQGTKISAAEARPGDLVVTDGTKGFATHAGIYIGEDQYGQRIYVSELPNDGTENSGKCVITRLTNAFEYRRVGNNTCTLSAAQAGKEAMIYLETIGIYDGCAPCFGEKDADGRCYFHYINVFGGEENVYFDDASRQACIEWCKAEYLRRGNEKFW